MKDRIVEIPRDPKKITVVDKILLLSDKLISGANICKMMEPKSAGNIRGTISNMVRSGQMECFHCVTCDVGRMYRRKK